MPRSLCASALVFDPEIERIGKANRKTKRQEDKPPNSSNLSANSKKEPDVEVPKTKDMAKQRTLRELTTPNVNQ